MIFIGKRSAWKAKDGGAEFFKERNGCRRIKISIPDGGIETKPAKIYRTESLSCIDAEMNEGRRRFRGKLNVINVEPIGAAIRGE